MKKVFILKPNEEWCVDRMGDEFFLNNQDMCVASPMLADVVWLMADWCFLGLARAGLLDNKRVLTTIHHLVPSKLTCEAIAEFNTRDKFTSEYHVFNRHTLEQVKLLTDKKITLIPYWCNQDIWKKTGDAAELRKKHKIPLDTYVVMSAQRDTEGSSIASGQFVGKHEKGPDLFCDYVEKLREKEHNLHVVLGGWRRQYVINRLLIAKIPYTYFELPSQEVINDLYNLSNLYVVASRFEGGPQALLEASSTGCPVVSRSVGIAEDVLPQQSINDDLTQCIPTIPVVPDEWKIPFGFKKYRELLQSL